MASPHTRHSEHFAILPAQTRPGKSLLRHKNQAGNNLRLDTSKASPNAASQLPWAAVSMNCVALASFAHTRLLHLTTYSALLRSYLLLVRVSRLHETRNPREDGLGEPSRVRAADRVRRNRGLFACPALSFRITMGPARTRADPCPDLPTAARLPTTGREAYIAPFCVLLEAVSE
jgi:hypothetical protein